MLNTQLASYEYCTTCAIDERGGGLVEATLVSESKIGARIWINGQEFAVEKTIKQLATDAEQSFLLGS